jgi:cytoskeletal protein CcmA (bactofilin family)
LQLSEYKNVREMHEKAIKKVMSFLKGEISSEEIWKMDGNVKGNLKNERFFYVGKVE